MFGRNAPEAPVLDRRTGGGELSPRWLVVGGIFLCYFALWGSPAGFNAAIDHFGLIFGDFTNHFYPQGRSIVHSSEPVEGFFYPPFAATLFAGVSMVPYPAALILWGIIQGMAIAVWYSVPFRFAPGLTLNRSLVYVAFSLMSVPMLHNVKWGQVSVLVTIAVMGALWLRVRGRSGISAMLLALAISIKYYPALLLIFFVIRKRLKYTGLVAVWTLLFSVVVPAVILGPDSAWRFTAAVLESSMGAAQTWVRHDCNSQSLLQVLGRLLPSGVGGALGAATWCSVVAGLAAAVVLSWPAKQGAPEHRVLAPMSLLLVVPLVVPTAWPHYFVFLPPIQLMTLNATFDGFNSGSMKGLLTAALWGFSVIVPSVPALLAAGGWVDYVWNGPMLWADLSLLVCVLAQRYWVVQPAPNLVASPFPTGAMAAREAIPR